MSVDAFIPPQNIEAEKAVLGGILLDNRAILDLPAEITAEVFYIPSHGQIFQSMLTLWEREAPIDAVSVPDQAKAAGQDIAMSCLIDIQEHGMPRSIEYHAKLVIAAFRQRRAINLVGEALRELQESPQRHDEIMSRLYSASDKAVFSRAVPIETVMVESLKRIYRAGADGQNPGAVQRGNYILFGLDRMKLLRPEEVAQVLGVSRSSARRLMIENSIPTVTIRSGRRKKILRVEEESLERWIRAREREGQRKPAVSLAS